jgi:hypothetical protein
MVKIKSFLALALVLCILLVGCLANSQQTSSGETRPEVVMTTASKRDLAIAVLAETGISKRYDLYLGNSIDVVVYSETARQDKFMAWMQALFVREAGWNTVEAKYVAQLEENFSEAELKELLNLAKQPLIKKLVKSEIEAYSASSKERRRLMSTLWDKYNSGVFTPPPEVLK